MTSAAGSQALDDQVVVHEHGAHPGASQQVVHSESDIIQFSTYEAGGQASLCTPGRCREKRLWRYAENSVQYLWGLAD
jgi:hypothetical protein